MKILGPALKYLLIGLTIIYAIDWIFFQMRQARGTAMRSISVQRYLATPLKGFPTQRLRRPARRRPSPWIHRWTERIFPRMTNSLAEPPATQQSPALNFGLGDRAGIRLP